MIAPLGSYESMAQKYAVQVDTVSSPYKDTIQN